MLTTYPKTESGMFRHLCHKLAESLWDPHTREAMKCVQFIGERLPVSVRTMRR